MNSFLWYLGVCTLAFLAWMIFWPTVMILSEYLMRREMFKESERMSGCRGKRGHQRSE